MAGGPLYAAFADTFYWITVPLLIGGSTAVMMIAALKIFWFGSTAYLIGGHQVTDLHLGPEGEAEPGCAA